MIPEGRHRVKAGDDAQERIRGDRTQGTGKEAFALTASRHGMRG